MTVAMREVNIFPFSDDTLYVLVNILNVPIIQENVKLLLQCSFDQLDDYKKKEKKIMNVYFLQ